MTDDSWQDRVVGARMTVDNEFEDRVETSSFSRQQWSLVMTATEFEIENPGDPDRARIVANTDNLDAILPELDTIEQQMGGMGGGVDGRDSDSSDGLFASIASALGLGSEDQETVDEERREEATELVQAYAEQLQAHLEDAGRWAEIRAIAAGE